MKIFGLFLLGLIAFAATFIWKFPAEGVLPYVNTSPVTLGGVQGTVWNGSAKSVVAPEPALPFTNVKWKASPSALLSGSAGANINFEVIGGKGEGLVKRNLAGNVFVTDGNYRVPASRLEQFLPLPVAEFGGIIQVHIDEMELENNLLKRTQGRLTWSQAEVKNTVLLGEVLLDITPQGEQHIGKLSNTDGQLDVRGDVLLDQAGNYKADIHIQPTAETPQQVDGVLSLLGRPASDGSYRIRNNGNIHNLQF